MLPFFNKFFKVGDLKKTLSSELSGCPKCNAQETIVFVYSQSPFRGSIQKIQDLRFDESLYRCAKCQTHWVYQNDYLKIVENLDLLHRWNAKLQLCPEAFLEVLHKIGKTNFLTVPCAAQLKNGQKFEACEFVFIDESPVWLDQSRPIFLVEDVAAIEPSPYALPHKVREKTAEAWEIRMGFAPTAVKAPDETVYLLHGIKNFFRQDAWLGPDLQKITAEFSEREAKLAHYEGPKPAIIIAELEPKLLHW